MTQLFIKTIGVGVAKTSSNTKQVGEVTVREWVGDKQKAEITIDCFTGSGNTYKRRERVLINVQFEDGYIWSGDFNKLRNLLLLNDY